jgi:hypothetical protein
MKPLALWQVTFHETANSDQRSAFEKRQNISQRTQRQTETTEKAETKQSAIEKCRGSREIAGEATKGKQFTEDAEAHRDRRDSEQQIPRARVERDPRNDSDR